MADTRTPIPTQKLLGDISTTVESVDQEALQTTVSEMGAAFGGTGRGPRADHRQRHFVHRRGQRQLRHHHRPDPRQQHRAPRPDRLGGRDPDLRQAARGCSPAPWPARTRTCAQVIDNGSATANELRRFLDDNKVDLAELINELVTTGEVVVRAPGGHRAAAGGLPVRRRGRLHRRGAVTRHRALRRPLRDGPHEQPRGLPRRLRVDRPEAAPGRREPADEHERALRRAAHAVQRPWRAERPATGPRGGLRTTAPTLHWGTRLPRDLSSPGSLAPRTLGGDSWKWLFLQPLMSSRE